MGKEADAIFRRDASWETTNFSVDNLQDLPLFGKGGWRGRDRRAGVGPGNFEKTVESLMTFAESCLSAGVSLEKRSSLR